MNLRGLQVAHDLWPDVRYGLRMLARNPGFSAAAIAMLGLGIAVNVTVFTLTNAVLFKGFRSIDRNGRILYIGTQNNGRGCCVSYPDFADWRTQATSFEGLGAVADSRVTLDDTGGVESFTATQVSANAFALVGKRPLLGRDFTAADEAPGAAPVAILSHGLWERRYGSDPSLVGRTVRINGVPTIVIGVMPQAFAFPQNQDLWVPLVPTGSLQRRDVRTLWFAFGRLKDGVTAAGARAEMETIGRRLASEYPRTNQGWVPGLRTFAEFFIGRNAATIYGAMWGAVGFVLLIACANLANLMLARAMGRSREISVRMALGAGRWRIVRQLLIESSMLAAAGGCVGWWAAKWGVRTYELVANPPTLSWSDHLVDYSMDFRVFAYLLVVSMGAALLCGLAPALRLSRLDVGAALKDGGRAAIGGGRRKRLAALLVAAEIALAVVLLAGAGVMIRSFLNIYRADIGVNTSNSLTMLLALPESRYPTAEAQVAFHDRLEARLQAIGGVESVAIASALPLAGTAKRPYELAGDPVVDEQRRPTLSAVTVGAGYFQTVGALVIAGREFTHADAPVSVPVALVNQQFARRHWPGEESLGKRIRFFDGASPQPWMTVVGVVSNIVQNDVTRQDFEPLVYVPFRQKPASSMWVIARTRVPPGGLAAAFRREVQALDPDQPLNLGPFTLADRLAGFGAYWTTGNDAALFLIFAVIGLMLASVGLYAVIAHAVSQRTQEIGIRIAIGATPRDIVGLVLEQGLPALGLGLTIGLAASFAVNRVLQSMLVRVSPVDPLSLGVASAVLLGAATLGCAIPARRAMRVDPMVALRHE